MNITEEQIDEVRNHGAYLKNDGTLEQLREVIKTVFLKCSYEPSGGRDYYGVSSHNKNMWTTYSTPYGKTISIKSLFNEDLKVEDKKIIGYKLIKPEYNSVAIDITDMKNKHWEGFIKDDFYKKNSFCINYDGYVENLKAAGVLDIWFEPVYEEEFKLPKINGYEGNLKNNKLTYGCAHLSKKWFNSSNNRHIKSMVLSSGVEINENEMNQIREYLNKNQ